MDLSCLLRVRGRSEFYGDGSSTRSPLPIHGTHSISLAARSSVSSSLTPRSSRTTAVPCVRSATRASCPGATWAGATLDRSDLDRGELHSWARDVSGAEPQRRGTDHPRGRVRCIALSALPGHGVGPVGPVSARACAALRPARASSPRALRPAHEPVPSSLIRPARHDRDCVRRQ